MDKKKCTKCGKLKTLDNFHKSKKGKNGLNSRCKECVSQYQIKHYRDKWTEFFGFDYNLMETNRRLFNTKMNRFVKEHPEYFE